jgi:hypothetical protein
MYEQQRATSARGPSDAGLEVGLKMHGSAFDYYSTPWFPRVLDSPMSARTGSSQSRFCGRARLCRELNSRKSFFFFSFETARQQCFDLNPTVPLEAWRGLFSGVTIQGSFPAIWAFPNNFISADRINSVSKRFRQFWPLPTMQPAPQPSPQQLPRQ